MLSEALTSAATAVVGVLKGQPSDNDLPTIDVISCAKVSGQYLEHLEKLKKLLECGVLSTAEFEEQKEIALTNIKQLNSK